MVKINKVYVRVPDGPISYRSSRKDPRTFKLRVVSDGTKSFDKLQVRPKNHLILSEIDIWINKPEGIKRLPSEIRVRQSDEIQKDIAVCPSNISSDKVEKTNLTLQVLEDGTILGEDSIVLRG